MELEGDGEQLPLPAGANLPDGGGILPEINFDDGERTSIFCLVSSSKLFSEDQTNLHRHARANAQEAIALARARAQEFDNQVATVRKTKEPLKLAQNRSQQVQEEEETVQVASGPSSVPLDRELFNFSYRLLFISLAC